MNLKPTDQVVIRSKTLNRNVQVRIGTIISIEGSKAEVGFADGPKRRETFNLNQLESVSSAFPGRNVVRVNPTERRIAKLYR
jgi:hypothetical protein